MSRVESSSMLKTGQNALFTIAVLWAAATHSASGAEKSSKGTGKADRTTVFADGGMMQNSPGL